MCDGHDARVCERALAHASPRSALDGSDSVSPRSIHTIANAVRQIANSGIHRACPCRALPTISEHNPARADEHDDEGSVASLRTDL